MSITTTTQIDGPVNNIFQVNLLARAEALCPYYVGTVPASVSEHQGTFTAKWRRFDNLTPVTTALAELTGALGFPTRTGSQVSKTDITATVSKYGDYIIVGEEVDLVNFNGQALEFTDLLAHQAGTSLNRLQRDEMEDNSTQVFGGTATTATDINASAALAQDFTVSLNTRVVNALDNQVARKFVPMTTGSRNIGTSPIRSAYWAITHPDVVEDLRTLTGFTEVQDYASQTAIAPGEEGSLGNVRFISTTEATIDAGGGDTATGSATIDGRSTSSLADVYNTVVYGMNAVGSLGFGREHVKESYRAGDRLPSVMMISKPRGSAGTADPLNEVATMGWKSWHAPVLLNSNWIRGVKTAASRLE